MAEATIERLIDALNVADELRVHRVVVTYTFEAEVNRRLLTPRLGQARGTVDAYLFDSPAQPNPVWVSLGQLTVRGTEVLEYRPEPFTPYLAAKRVLDALAKAGRKQSQETG